MPRLIVLMVLATLAASELMIHLPVSNAVSTMLVAGRKSIRVLASSRISDHWKERALQAYAGQLAVGTVTLVFMIAVLIAPFLVVALIVENGFAAVTELSLHPAFLVTAVGVASGYVYIRRKLV